MRYNVAQLLKEQSGHTRQYTLREAIDALDPEIAPLSPLAGTVQLIRTADGIFVLGNLHTSLELTCARCLVPFALPLEFSLEEEFRPTIDIHTGATLPLTADDEVATRIDAHHEIDLSEVVRQGILLAIPPGPICRSKCAGLCAICGKNLNEGACDCKRDEIDPRFEKLKELLDKK
ncbi:MAG: DUF177 domain-containing protein [Chloroflexi bacterium]|nr:DUF177 domain-containing protein [Chloroflexota bacterium]